MISNDSLARTVLASDVYQRTISNNLFYDPTNLININLSDKGYPDSQGNIRSFSTVRTTKYLSRVGPNEVYRCYAENYEIWRVMCHDRSGKFLRTKTVGRTNASNKELMFTIPDDTFFIR